MITSVRAGWPRLPRLTGRRPSAEAYFRLDRVDPLLQAFRNMEAAWQRCETGLAACEQRLAALAPSPLKTAGEDKLRCERDAALAEIASLRAALDRMETAAAQRVAAVRSEADRLRIELAQFKAVVAIAEQTTPGAAGG